MTVALPLAVLIAQSSSLSAYADAFARASGSILRSLVFAVVGASLLTLLGFFCGYLIHNRTLPIWRGVDALTLFLFTLPGTVVGIGLISLWNTPMSNFIYRHPGDHHSWISRSIRSASDTDDVCNSGPYSAFIGTGRAALRRKLVHDAAGYCGAVGADVA